ncbi:hypothetical protein BHM03_00055553 [Ensete ventricosum]|nr:hypothetical protein BHM03_00055553 [Ensete ventricosum]
MGDQSQGRERTTSGDPSPTHSSIHPLTVPFQQSWLFLEGRYAQVTCMCLTHQSYFSGVFCPVLVFMATLSLFLLFVPHQSSQPMAYHPFKEDASPPSPFFPLVEVGEARNKESDLAINPSKVQRSLGIQSTKYIINKQTHLPVYVPPRLIGISHIPTPPPPPLFPIRSPSLFHLSAPSTFSPPRVRTVVSGPRGVEKPSDGGHDAGGYHGEPQRSIPEVIQDYGHSPITPNRSLGFSCHRQHDEKGPEEHCPSPRVRPRTILIGNVRPLIALMGEQRHTVYDSFFRFPPPITHTATQTLMCPCAVVTSVTTQKPSSSIALFCNPLHDSSDTAFITLSLLLFRGRGGRTYEELSISIMTQPASQRRDLSSNSCKGDAGILPTVIVLRPMRVSCSLSISVSVGVRASPVGGFGQGHLTTDCTDLEARTRRNTVQKAIPLINGHLGLGHLGLVFAARSPAEMRMFA